MYLFSLILACQPERMDSQAAQNLIIQEFEKLNSTKGRLSWVLDGKAQWSEGRGFERSCLDEKDIAFHHHLKAAKIQPTLSAQKYFTTSTKKGYCLDMGEGLSIVVDSIASDSASVSAGSYKTTVHFEMKEPTPWFSCLSENFLSRDIYLKFKDGAISIDDSSGLALREDEECIQPGVAFVERKETPRPTEAPKKAPSQAEIQDLLTKFDQALFDYDYAKATSYVSCANLIDAKWGYCTLAELLPLGQILKEERMRDGNPWLSNTARDFSVFTTVTRDSKDPTMYHLRYKDRRNKKPLSISIQYVGGEWKLFGAIAEVQQGITPLSFILNLHDKETKEIFERRLAGEQIDSKGRPLNPFEKPAEDSEK